MYTFAEIRFLAAGSAECSAINALLGFPDEPLGDEVAEAALASLCLRGLARVDETKKVVLSEVARSAIALLRACDHWLDLVLIKPALGSMSLIYGCRRDERLGVLISAVGPGVFRVDPLDITLSPGEQLRSIADTLLEGPGMLFLSARGAHAGAITLGNRSGAYVFGDRRAKPDFVPVSRQAGLEQFVSRAERTLAGATR